MTDSRAHFNQFEEFRRMSKRQQERIIRLNPEPHEGETIRGRFPKPMSWRHVKIRLLRGDKSPMGWFRVRGGNVYHGIFIGPIDLCAAQRRGWL